MEKLYFFNTLSRSKEAFKPLRPPMVGLYTCGPTVYNDQHIGNFRTAIFQDTLKRVLRLSGYQVRHVMNVTDVGHLTSDADEGEDKIEVGAAREGMTAWEIAEHFTQRYLKDLAKLNIIAPDVLCRATGHIPEQIELARRLEAKGLTYRIEDGVYFDTSKFPGYGRLDPSRLEGLKPGARVEMMAGKKNPTDFALWKFSPKDKKRQMEWPSPWGVGFPGWHLECSAMAMHYLGESFDIHCGGADLITIHHTNEIAQAEGATGKQFVRFWMHGEFLVMNQAKMAKSAGGFVTVRVLEEKGVDPLAYRYYCTTAHYRKQLDFTWEALEAAQSALNRLRDRAQALFQESRNSPGGVEETALVQKRFVERLEDDLDIPGAVAALWETLKAGAISPKAQYLFLEACDAVLGLDLLKSSQDQLPEEIRRLVEEREDARLRRDFKTADEIRLRLAAKGFVLEDFASGVRWKKRQEKESRP
ncbi:MAG: cysteine--tRNA ligase [Elusimicrobia bacterium RIFCSPLOWO2_12_FULL_59_9]|nr:MAG: cysteine--tRNA ligase [Elusimicrobia bacterium RIFCSPLOWO2_12_FULL_59_9]